MADPMRLYDSKGFYPLGLAVFSEPPKVARVEARFATPNSVTYLGSDGALSVVVVAERVTNEDALRAFAQDHLREARGSELKSWHRLKTYTLEEILAELD